MPITDSPLRYPGGKSQLTKFVKNLISINGLVDLTYIEPFSGGSGISINLILNDVVKRIIINDIDPSIHAFWYSILNMNDEFIEKILETPVTIESWHAQKQILEKYKNDPHSLANGFATFYLNRTNRSGIISGGVIGGLKQNGKYKIDCRFNKKSLIEKIEKIGRKKSQIILYNLDAKVMTREIIRNLNPKNSFIFFDPPYYVQGKNLYTNSFEHEDHILLRDAIINLNDYYWITTYDYQKQLIDLYSSVPNYQYYITYSAQNKRKEKELLFCSQHTKIESFEKVVVDVLE
ncbi:DNA adenine methylase [Paenibacillus sp. DCT19]|uniref:DNA adenine methylase n=1 Tax=Paenibacillus sp. DCT19 TaxID=2211212 RepID=UPI000FE23DC9|nr:DNA adenine methylase [Paenibacillus sp. DCT19]